MAEITGLADDLDGTPQWIRPVTRHTFTLDGVEHVVDLHDENAAQMRADFAKWINASRAVGKGNAVVHSLQPTATPKRTAVTKKVKGKRGHRDPAQLKAERDWLRSHGHQVSPFGKIPDEMHRLWENHLASLGKRGGYSGSDLTTADLFSAAN